MENTAKAFGPNQCKLFESTDSKSAIITESQLGKECD